MFRWRIVLLQALAVGVAAFVAMTGGLARAQSDAKRVALVVGNSAYRNVETLTNPANDATDIAAKLKSLKFDVLLATNATQAEMKSLLSEFKSRVVRDRVALVFFAGHGVTINRESFLLPVDVPAVIDADEKGELRPEMVNSHLIGMADVLAPLEMSRLGIVFLDACRTNEFVPGKGLTLRVALLSATRKVPIIRGAGSVEIKPSPYSAGVFRAYATQLDNVASDGAGRNSPFTKALLKHIGTRGLSIQDLMIRVRRSVMEETKNEQIPWEEAALNEPFFFVEAPPPAPAPRPPVAGTPGAGTPAAKPAGTPSNAPSVGVGF
jgi:uncharacterized caspase-like protein